jgi:hypothetical protein
MQGLNRGRKGREHCSGRECHNRNVCRSEAIMAKVRGRFPTRHVLFCLLSVCDLPDRDRVEINSRMIASRGIG